MRADGVLGGPVVARADEPVRHRPVYAGLDAAGLGALIAPAGVLQLVHEGGDGERVRHAGAQDDGARGVVPGASAAWRQWRPDDGDALFGGVGEQGVQGGSHGGMLPTGRGRALGSGASVGERGVLLVRLARHILSRHLPLRRHTHRTRNRPTRPAVLLDLDLAEEPPEAQPE